MLAMEYKNPLDSLSQSQSSIFHPHQMSPEVTSSPVQPIGLNDRSLQYMAEDSPDLDKVYDEEEGHEYDIEADEYGHDSQMEDNSPGVWVYT